MSLLASLRQDTRLAVVLGGMPAELDGAVSLSSVSTISPFQTVGENVLLGNEPGGFFVRRRAQDERASALLAQVGVSVDPAVPVLDLDRVERRLVELARLLGRSPHAIVIDDRDSGFIGEERERWEAALIGLSTELRIVLVSDSLPGLGTQADEVVVVRHGRVAGTARPDEAEALIDLLAEDGNGTGDLRAVEWRSGAVVLELRDWTVSQPIDAQRIVIDGAGLRLRGGTITGIGGAVSQDLLLSVFGRSTGGDITGELLLDGEGVELRDTQEAIAAGVVFLSEHPPSYDVGLIGGIPTNVSGDSLARLARFGLIDPRREYVPRRAPSMILAAIPGARREPSVVQVHEMLESWAAKPPRVVLFAEPFAGLSPAERAERFALIEPVAAAGAAVVLSSWDPEPLIGCCDRLAVLSSGRLGQALDARELGTMRRSLAALAVLGRPE